jgi:hypothetical protein
MCWACEEEAMWRRYQLEVAVERGEIPPGFEPEDFEAAGLPVPAKRAAAETRADAANPFACDAPDKA